MSKFSAFILLIICAILPLHLMQNLPPSIKICPAKSPNLAQCVKESLEKMRNLLASGNFGTFKITPVEPLEIQNIEIQRGSNFLLSLDNVKGRGASKFKIDKLRINLDNFVLEALATVPKIDATGKYKMNMRLGILDLKGEGDATATLDGTKVKIKFIGSRYIKNGLEYLKFDRCDVVVKITKMSLYFDNLFSGDKVLGDVGNQLVNQNIDMFIKDLEAPIGKSISRQFLATANSVLEQAPFKALFS